MDPFFEIIRKITGKKIEEKKQLIPSPFRKDTHPSFSIYQWKGVWFFKDFATGESGTAAHLLCKYMNLPYKTAMQMINKTPPAPPPAHKTEKETLTHTYTNASFECTDISVQYIEIPYEKSYFSALGIKKDTCEMNKIVFTDSVRVGNYRYNGWVVIYKDIRSFNEEVSCRGIKVYMPNNVRAYKFLGNKKWHHIFGIESLGNYDANYCFIGAGEKDTCVLQQVFRCSGICFNSETYLPNECLLEWIKKLGKKIVICYDNDAVGKRYSILLKERLQRYGIKSYIRRVPERYKDVSEMYEKERTVYFERH